ncbi:MAG: DUF3830 family protein [Chloroflexi bacterium]|nr:DUF3830 family protein [Chloroflexota bacterium]
MAKEVLFTFLDGPDAGVSARAVLLEEAAPRTCAAVWAQLPLAITAGHGAYSGTIVGVRLDPSVIVGEENATTCVQTGDVMFTHYEPHSRHGYPAGLSEIYWAYDRYARPHVPGQWVPAIANVFARMTGDPTDFYAVCRRILQEGLKRIDIRRADDLTAPATVADYRERLR